MNDLSFHIAAIFTVDSAGSCIAWQSGRIGVAQQEAAREWEDDTVGFVPSPPATTSVVCLERELNLTQLVNVVYVMLNTADELRQQWLL